MPLSIYYTLDQLEEAALQYFRNRAPAGWDLSRESFYGKTARAFAMLALGIQKAASDADNDSTPSSKTSSGQLDAFALLFGISNSIGGYGRKPSVAAAGGKANLTGTLGTVYVDGSLLTAPDGVTSIKLSIGGPTTIVGSPPGTGVFAAAVFVAVTAGSAGNLGVNSILTWVSPPAGADPSVTLTTALSGGLEIETDTSLLSRILARLQNPPKGGSSSDFRGWAEANTGVLRAFPYPLRGGLGTEHNVITGPGTGTGRDPGAGVKTTVDNYINGTTLVPGQRSVPTQGYLTLRPYMPAYPTGSLTIRLRVKPSKAKYNFDWDDTAGPYTVSAYSAGTGAGGSDRLTLSAALPATLSAAIDNGLKPRIQILVSTAGGPVVPLLCQIQGRAGGGNTFDLQNPLPAGWVAPTNGDALYAGGPCCVAIATAVVANIDALGPSRAGGYADINDTWDDTADTGKIAQIAFDTFDTDGVTRFIKGFVQTGSPGVNQVTIAYGNGTAGTGNVQAGDTTVNGPELLYCRFVVVTQ